MIDMANAIATCFAGEDPGSEIIDVTPGIAVEWLEANAINRNLKRSKLASYRRSIEAGRWNITGESIKFSKSGRLLDGQHRLTAVAQSGMTIKTYVVWGLEDEAQVAMDSGVPRSAADVLAIDGLKNRSRVTAVARLALAEHLGLPFDGIAFSNLEVVDFIQKTPDLSDAVELLGQRGRQTPVVTRVADLCFWKFYRLDPDAALQFFTSFASGANLEADNPILVLRRRLTGEYGQARRIRINEQISLVIRAWNYWRKGEPINRLQSSTWKGFIEIPDPI